MSRPLRLHVDHGFYYVIQRSGVSRCLFGDPEEYAQFEAQLTKSLTRWSARIHAFCWLPHEVHLLVQVSKEPIGRFMQHLTSRYSCWANQKSGYAGSMFRNRYAALLIDPERYLLDVVRHIHQTPVREHMASDLDTFRTSSHVAYADIVSIPWLTTKTTRALLEKWGRTPAEAYRKYMCANGKEAQDPLVRRDHRVDPRVLGDPKFIARLPRSANAYRSVLSLEQLTASVALTLGVRQEEIHSRSSGHYATLARAVIAWHAVDRGVATLAEVAQRLDRGPSSLCEAIARYRKRRPELFRRDALRQAAPLLPGLLLDQQFQDTKRLEEK